MKINFNCVKNKNLIPARKNKVQNLSNFKFDNKNFDLNFGSKNEYSKIYNGVLYTDAEEYKKAKNKDKLKQALEESGINSNCDEIYEQIMQLQKTMLTKNIYTDFDSILNICKYSNFNFDEINNLKQENKPDIFRSIVLANLIEDGLVPFDKKRENFSKNYKSHFKEKLLKIGVGEKTAEEIDAYLEKEVTFYNVYKQKVLPQIRHGATKNFENNKISAREYVQIMKKTSLEIHDSDIEMITQFLEKGFSLKMTMDLIRFGIKKTKIDYKKILDEIDSPKNTSIKIKKLQHRAGYTVQVEKSGIDNEFKTRIRVIKSFYEDGTVTTERAEIKNRGDRTVSMKNSDENFLFNAKNGGIKEFLEFKTKNPQNIQIIYTKPSEILPGAYKISKFDLENYPQTLEVPVLIRRGLLKGNEKIAIVEQKGNTTISEESYTQNGCETKRKYFVKKDENQQIYETKYSYTIKKGEKNLLNLKRSWKKISDTQTITKINNKTYVATFDDKNLTVEIEDKTTGDIIPIDIKGKLFNYYGKENKKFRPFFQNCKNLTADSLLVIQRSVDGIKINPDGAFVYDENQRRLETDSTNTIVYHELGHAMDFWIEDNDYKMINGELKNIYNREMNEFRKNNPKALVEFIDYFSQDGGGECNTGLEELIAESFVLFNTYNHNIDEELMTRAHYLVKYFPQTMAKILNKFKNLI